MQVVGFIWFLGICVGHAALLTLSINWWYSFALPARLLSCMRLAHGGLVFLGLAAFTRAYLFPSAVGGLSFGTLGQSAAGAYALLCGLIGLGYVPLLALWRLGRGQPAALRSNHTATVDGASRLGSTPIGRGKCPMLSHVPADGVFRVAFAQTP